MITVYRHVAIALMSFAYLMSCATHTGRETQLTLSRTLKNPEIVSLPYELFGKGIFMVTLTVADHSNRRFLIDTGATRSAMYKSAVRELDLIQEADATISVHGMLQSGKRPLVIVPSLSVGNKRLENVKMAVLENRNSYDEQGEKPDGLIGMDLLSNYRIFVDADSQTFNLIPRTVPAPVIPWQWETVQLMPNPFVEDERDLHFLNIRLGNHQLPALLDTGSEENLMNWSVSKYPQLRFARKKLYEEWLLAGAIGEFDPRYSVRAKNLRSGGKYWKETRFVVLEFEGLEILGVKDQPFLIAGSPLLARETFYLDFAENVIKFRPPRTKQSSYSIFTLDTDITDRSQ